MIYLTHKWVQMTNQLSVVVGVVAGVVVGVVAGVVVGVVAGVDSMIALRIHQETMLRHSNIATKHMEVIYRRFLTKDEH